MTASAKQLPYTCRNCRRIIHLLDGIGWLHDELPTQLHRPLTCENPHPSCMYRTCDHLQGPDPACPCRCHLPAAERPSR